MLIWNTKLGNKLKELEIENDLRERFIDDISIVIDEIEEGIKYSDGKLLKVNEGENIDTNSEERTMKIIQNIANEIDDNIKVTFDIPSRHPENKVPI